MFSLQYMHVYQKIIKAGTVSITVTQIRFVVGMQKLAYLAPEKYKHFQPSQFLSNNESLLQLSQNFITTYTCICSSEVRQNW